MSVYKKIILIAAILLTLGCNKISPEQATKEISKEIMKNEISTSKIIELKEKGGELLENDAKDIILKELEKQEIENSERPNFKKIKTLYQLGVKLKDTDSLILSEKAKFNPNIYKLLILTIFNSDETNLKENLKALSGIKDKDGRNIFYCAVYTGYIDVVKIMLEMKEPVNYIRKDGWTPLLAAIRTQNIELVKLLLENKADVNPNGESNPLMMAFSMKNEEIFEVLIKSGANISSKEIEFFVERNQDKFLERIIEKEYIKPDIFIGEVSKDPKNLNLLSFLISKGVNPNLELPQDADLNTPTALGYASSNGNIEAVKLLIKSGADVNKTISSGYRFSSMDSTPLCFAAENGHVEVVKELLKLNADPNKEDSLVAAIRGSGNLEIVKELLKAGANVNGTKVNMNGITEDLPLNEAIRYSHVEIVKELIAHKPDLNKEDFTSKTAIELGMSTSVQEIRQIFTKLAMRKYIPSKSKVLVNNIDKKYMLYNENGHVILFENLMTAAKVYRIFKQGDFIAAKKILDNSQNSFGYFMNMNNYDSIKISKEDHYYEGFMTGYTHKDEENIIGFRIAGTENTLWTFREYLESF